MIIHYLNNKLNRLLTKKMKLYYKSIIYEANDHKKISKNKMNQ